MSTETTSERQTPPRHAQQASASRSTDAALTDRASGSGVPSAIAIGLAVVFLLLWAGIGVDDDPGDLVLYFDYANAVDDGRAPYRDVQVEYPPLALVPILIAFYPSDVVGGFFDGFELLFALETYLLALASGLLSWSIMRRVIPDASEDDRRWRMASYVAAFPLLGQIVTTRLDLAPTALTMAAIALWLRRTSRSEFGAWVVLAAGVATKLTPVIIAPLFAIDAWQRRSFRSAVAGGVIFLASVGVFFLPGVFASPEGIRTVLTYHSERGVQIESIYATGVLWWSRIGDFHVQVAHAFGAFEAVSPATGPLRVLSTVLQIGALGAVYLTVLVVGWSAREQEHRDRLLVLGATLALAVFIAFGKVFSPQYLIWLIPLIVLVPGRIGRWVIGLFLLTLACTQILFPYSYEALVQNTTSALAVLTYRNVLYLIMTGLLVAAFTRAATTRSFHS